MSKLFWQAVKFAPVVFAASLFAASGASAQSISADKEAVNETLQQINDYQKLEQQGSMSQVTNVNQLRDVSPTDWAYEALRSLVDRYGCIAGFPNQTYRGEQALTRYEFAAGLNSCLNQIERLIASSQAVSQEDLDTINRLQQEFEAELATLGGRVDELESRTAVLEDTQFSTTTKLNGEAIVAVADVFGGGVDNVDDDEVPAETTLSARARLNFDTSFTGEDRLRTRLEAANIVDLGEGLTGTDSTRLGFDNNNDLQVDIADLHYRFPVNDRVTGWVGAQGLNFYDVFNVGNPTLESSGSGALSRFNRYDPVMYRGTDGAGVAANVDLIPDRLGVNIAYLTDGGGADPTSGSATTGTETEGLFGGSFSAGAQLEFKPIESLGLTATYVRNYQTSDSVNQSGGTVSGAPVAPFGAVDTTADKFGIGANFELGEKLVIGASGGYASLNGLVAGDDNNLDGEIWTWQANVSFLDLIKEGSQLSVAGGMVPRFTSDTAGVVDNTDTSYLVEALYKFPLSDNIELTPGAYVVFNANHDDNNDPVYVGALRTTFKF
ncbi:carbohydrate-selective porin OprB [Chondrocystis sp. NIES-4102]|nr:carbohydrate-selective porin OprB [Chondrocystis sp. NIES-4102]